MLTQTASSDALLPTLATAYEVVDGYADYLTRESEHRPMSSRVSLAPVDALLLWLLASYQPHRIDIFDDVQADTAGASTVLCRTIPAVRSVVVRRHASGLWARTVDSYLAELDHPTAEMVAITDGAAIGQAAVDESALTFAGFNRARISDFWLLTSVAKGAEGVAVQAQRWLESSSGGVVAVLGVGDTGACPVLAGLVQCCAEASLRLELPRERAPALSGSRLAIVARRSNESCAEALFRIGRLFADHFQYLRLVQQACESALEPRELARPARSPADIELINGLRRALQERERELADLRKSTAVSLAGRLRRIRQFLAAPLSTNRWLHVGKKGGSNKLISDSNES